MYIGKTIHILVTAVLGVSIALIIVSTARRTQAWDDNQLYVIGYLRQDFKRTDNFGLWMVVGAELVGLVALVISYIAKNQIYETNKV